MIRVEALVCPHDGYKIFRIGQIDDIMRVSGEHMNCLYLLAAHLEVEHFFRADLPLLDQRLAGNHNEEFPLGMMPMLTLGDSGLGDIHAELAAVLGTQQLRKAAPGIHIHFQRECCLFLGQIGKIGGIQLLCKAVVVPVPLVRRFDGGHDLLLRLHTADRCCVQLYHGRSGFSSDADLPLEVQMLPEQKAVRRC